MTFKHFDKLGRIHIPKKVRDKVGWTKETPLKFSVDTKRNAITIEKEFASCSICGGTKNLLKISDGFSICKDCSCKIKEKI